MLEEMAGISLDSMLVKWHIISNGLIYGRIQGAQNAGVQSDGNQNGLVVVLGIANQSGTGNVVAARAEGIGIGNQARCYNCRGLGILDEIKEVNANCILMANLQQVSTSGTQHDRALVYDTDGSAEVHLNDNCYDNEIFNMFTQEEQYTDLLEPIPEPQLVPPNDNHVTYVPQVWCIVGEDKFLDKEVDLEARIKDLENILLKRDQTVQTMHMLNPKPDSFYHSNQKMALGYPNSSYLKKAQQKQQSLYNGNLLLKEHDPPAEYDSEETLDIAQERVFVPQTTKSKEELFLSNVFNMVTASKTLSIPNEDLSDDTTPRFTIGHLLLKKRFTELYLMKLIQFLQEAAKFVRDFKSLAKEADESLDKQKSLELEIERLLKASVSHDIMFIVQNSLVDVPFDLRTELDRTKEKLKHCIIKKEKEYAILWNNWYTKCEECKYDKISYDKAYNDMQQKV
nr:hypothetical protein [Tanacetum cinerariifolium]